MNVIYTYISAACDRVFLGHSRSRGCSRERNKYFTATSSHLHSHHRYSRCGPADSISLVGASLVFSLSALSATTQPRVSAAGLYTQDVPFKNINADLSRSRIRILPRLRENIFTRP